MVSKPLDAERHGFFIMGIYKKIPKVTFKCLVCSTEFIQRASYNIYCSKPCCIVGNNNKASKKRIKINSLKTIPDLVGETWKDVDGYNGVYSISNLGRVKSLYYSTPKILSANNQKGYKSVTFVDSLGAKRLMRVHRLVAMAFIPNPDNKPFVNHIDCIRDNNSIDNLEWVTEQENCNHAIYMGRAKNQKIVLDTETGIYYNCVRDAANSKGLNYVTLLCRLNGSLENKTSFISA